MSKICHLAKHFRSDGKVSALCAKKPRAINLKVALWTNREEAVTCGKCKAIIEVDSRERA